MVFFSWQYDVPECFLSRWKNDRKRQMHFKNQKGDKNS